MSDTFADKLAEAVRTNNSLLCVGLDPDLDQIPGHLHGDVAKFNREIIEATSSLVCAYKPNLAFYEALGADGWDALRETLRAVPSHIPVIADGKRGDIGNTAAAYARAALVSLGCDAMTVNAWGGKDSVEPFLEHTTKGILIWCRSSNPSAVDFQDLVVDFRGGRMPLWQAMALNANDWNTHDNVGLVMGATYPAQLGEARRLCPTMPFLVPGVGAQDGSLSDSVRAGVTAAGDGIIINASRSVLYASRDTDYAMMAQFVAERLRNNINLYRNTNLASTRPQTPGPVSEL
jgi:orotidine-5'-phosphate decarboxylase